MTELEHENFYRENLERDIIFCICKRKQISFEEAMRFYYQSQLATKIYKGEHGIQYLDHSVLADILENESF